MDLNIEQKKIAFSKPNGHALLKGVAGSGKTTVGIYRIPFLLNNYCYAKDDEILFCTYTKTLINYVSYIFDKIDVSEREKMLFTSEEKKVSIKSIDKLMYEKYISYSKKNDKKYGIITNKKREYEIISDGISKLSKTYPKVNILDQRNTMFLYEEIKWIKSNMYLEIEEYQNADRKGKQRIKDSEKPQRIMKNSDTRKAIFELMNYYNEEIKKDGYIDYQDMELFALEEIRNNNNMKYTHIIIDESQDLSKIQLSFLKEILNTEKEYSSITFIADTTQSIYNHSWLGSGNSFSSIGFNMVGKSNSLSKNFRTTTEISEAAYSLIENDEVIISDENFVKPYLIDKHGEYPVLKIFKSDILQAKFIAEEIEKLSSKYELKDIAIVSRINSGFEMIIKEFKERKIECCILKKDGNDFYNNSVKLLTMHAIKGLEFKAVFLISLNEKMLPYYLTENEEERNEQEHKERKLLYVGMTRATEKLYLTSNNIKYSKFISDINKNYLRMTEECKFGVYYNVSIDKYLFKEKINDEYSQEEKVRQWLLKELKEKYKYPEELIDIEFPIFFGSKKGFVDIAISKYKNNKKMPFIFIEIKSLYSGIESAREQLKSYMRNFSNCEIGIVTDGNEIEILDQNFDLISDIPNFDFSMLPSGIRYLDYIDLRKEFKCTILKDDDEPNELEIATKEESQSYLKEELVRLNVFGNIAAGTPINMNVDTQQHFFLPREWFKSEDYFILKVTGDSMIGAGVEKGDFVVLKSQNTADRRDIVAVAIEEETATLKRFDCIGGDMIILSSENQDYEPILISSEKIRIMGIAVGVIKTKK